MYATRPDHIQAVPPVYMQQRRSSPSRNFGFMTEAPVLFGGALLSLAVMGTIFVNAVWFQPVAHPSPLFTPRAASAAPQITQVEQVAALQTNATVKADDSAAREILREVQSALAGRGYYSGKVDGIYGSRSEKAITTFQRDNGLNVDGKPSVRLLTQILLSGNARPAEVPVPAPIVSVKTKPVPAPQETATATSSPDGLIARIQQGLREFGYDQLEVDGRMGQQTTVAIQRFQLYFGMKITGEPSQEVLDKLREVGAYQQG